MHIRLLSLQKDRYYGQANELTELILNPFAAMLAAPSLRKRPFKVPNLKLLVAVFPIHLIRERISIKMHSTESGFVKGPSNILFASLYVCTFQPGNFTGWGSDAGSPPSGTKSEILLTKQSRCVCVKGALSPNDDELMLNVLRCHLTY